MWSTVLTGYTVCPSKRSNLIYSQIWAVNIPIFLKVIHFLPQLKIEFIKYTLEKIQNLLGSLINKSLKYIMEKIDAKGY